MVLTNQIPAQRSSASWEGAGPDRTAGYACSPESPAAVSDPSQGSDSSPGGHRLPPASKWAAGPEEAEGAGSEACIHSAGQKSWLQVQQLPEGFFLSSHSELTLNREGPCSRTARAGLPKEPADLHPWRGRSFVKSEGFNKSGSSQQELGRCFAGEDVDRLLGINVALSVAVLSGDFVFHRSPLEKETQTTSNYPRTIILPGCPG